MNEKKTLLEFPCDFPIKIIGKNTTNFPIDITDITRKHFPQTEDDAINFQRSENGNYLSITIVLYVHDQKTLDTLYRELTQHVDVKMVL